MKCQRCWSDQEPAYRVYTDALNIKVCATCAKEALGLGIAVEVLSEEKGKATCRHVRGYQEQGNINAPLELAIRNQTDRFSLAIDTIDRMPRFRVTGASVREALVNQRIQCEEHAYQFGVDRPDITDWKWPF